MDRGILVWKIVGWWRWASKYVGYVQEYFLNYFYQEVKKVRFCFKIGEIVEINMSVHDLLMKLLESLSLSTPQACWGAV